MGADHVRITTADDGAACAELSRRFGVNANATANSVSFSVPDGEQFVPRLLSGLGIPIQSVSVTRPSLNDVFMSYTGRVIRDAGSGADGQNRNIVTAVRGRRDMYSQPAFPGYKSLYQAPGYVKISGDLYSLAPGADQVP